MYFAYVLACCLIPVSSTLSQNLAQPGFLKRHLQIYSAKTVEAADNNSKAVTARTYTEYPLLILQNDKTEITRVTADDNGNYSIALAAGHYLLDVLGRAPKRVRAKPQPFTIRSNETVHVNMQIDTGIR